MSSPRILRKTRVRQACLAWILARRAKRPLYLALLRDTPQAIAQHWATQAAVLCIMSLGIGAAFAMAV